MGTVKFTHTVPQIDAAVDSINGIAQRLGVDAIVPCTPEQYAAIETKSANTLYIVYGNDKFTLYYGLLPLPSGGGGGSAGASGRAVALVTGSVSTLSGEARTEGTA